MATALSGNPNPDFDRISIGVATRDHVIFCPSPTHSRWLYLLSLLHFAGKLNKQGYASERVGLHLGIWQLCPSKFRSKVNHCDLPHIAIYVEGISDGDHLRGLQDSEEFRSTERQEA